MDTLKKVLGWLGIALLVLMALPMFIAGPDGETSTRPMGYVLLGIVAMILAYKYGMPMLARSTGNKIEAMAKEANDWAASLVNDQPPAVNTFGMIVPHGERAFLCEQPAQLAEVTTRRQMAHAGTRVKVGNMPFYFGGSEAITRREMTKSDSGTVMLTDKSVIFVGPLRTVAFSLRDVVQVSPSLDAFALNVRGRVTPVAIAVRNPLLWAGAITTLANHA